MKKQNGTKRKLMMGISTGILSVTAVAMPLALTSCGKKETNINNLDEVYGVDVTTYDNMKGRLTDEYRAKLVQERVEDLEWRMQKLSSSLKTLDEKIDQLSQSDASNKYTNATSVVLGMAKRLGVANSVNRSSRANWGEVDAIFSNMKSSFSTYMLNHSFNTSQINEVLKKATDTYTKMMSAIKTDYSNDILGGVLKAKVQLISCFDSINSEIAKLAGVIRLNEFASNYTFKFRDNAESYTAETAEKESNRLDKIESKYTKNQVISNQDMNKMFVCFNNETRQTVEFKDTMLPGYILRPKFMGTNVDTYGNNHSIKIDWTIVSQNVKPEDVEASTAHLTEVDDELANKTKQEGLVNSINDGLNQLDQKNKITEYPVLNSSDTENANLKSTYFNSQSNAGHIQFTWVWGDEKNKPCYDGYMFADQTSEDEQILSMRQLAFTNVSITDNNGHTELLKDVIERVNQKDYEPITLIENFVKNCNVWAKIKIRNTSNDNKTVTNEFVASYKNEYNWNQHYQLKSTLTSFQKDFEAVNLTTSDNFFDLVNGAYNDSYTDAHLYISKEYQDSYDKSVALSVVSSIGMLANVTALATTGVMLVAYAFGHQWKKFFTYLVATAIQGGLIATSSVFLNKILDDYMEPIADYAHNADKFTQDTEYDKVESTLNDDQDHFVLRDKEGKCDPELLAQKRVDFKKLEKSIQQELFHRYTTFNTDFAKEFFHKAEVLEIDPDKFNSDFADWSPEGKAFIVTMSCDVVSALLATFIGKIADKVDAHLQSVRNKNLNYVEEYIEDEAAMLAAHNAQLPEGFVPII